MLTTIPTPTVTKVTPFPNQDGGSLAAVTLAYGPIVIRAKLRKGAQGGVFLSMPARKDANDRWWEQCQIYDSAIRAQFEQQALQMYEAATAVQNF